MNQAVINFVAKQDIKSLIGIMPKIEQKKLSKLKEEELFDAYCEWLGSKMFSGNSKVPDGLWSKTYWEKEFKRRVNPEAEAIALRHSSEHKSIVYPLYSIEQTEPIVKKEQKSHPKYQWIAKVSFGYHGLKLNNVTDSVGNDIEEVDIRDTNKAYEILKQYIGKTIEFDAIHTITEKTNVYRDRGGDEHYKHIVTDVFSKIRNIREFSK